MTIILSWNIQNGLGVDGILSLSRIADEIRELNDPDIICLQEVSINTQLPDESFSDQVAELTAKFPDHTPIFGPAMDVWRADQSGRGQYGNLILTRYPVKSVFNHSLPQPADGLKKQMPRQMIEITVQAPTGALRVMTTHLEYHSKVQRLAQSQRVMEISQDIMLLDQDPPRFTDNGPYALFERASRCVLCGDFNFTIGSDEYKTITEPKDASHSLNDVWPIGNAGIPYAPTCGIHDNIQWPEGPHCRDFMFVSKDMTTLIDSMYVDTKTNASDHQPLVIKLNI